MEEINRDNVENNNSVDHLDKIFSLTEKISVLEKQCLYLKSDLETVRRNSFREIDHQVHKKEISIFSLLLLFLDDISRFFDAQKKISSPLDIEIMEKSVTKLLSDLHMEEVQANGLFDHSKHEALSFVETEDEKLDGIITMVVRKGYLHKNQLIRPSQVIIYKKY